MDINLWILVFIMLTPTGEIETHEVDFFGNIDECFQTPDDLLIEEDDSIP